jgi:hypothetical protein
LPRPCRDAGLAGWEKGGAYDTLFDVSVSDSFKGKVLEILENHPMPAWLRASGSSSRTRRTNARRPCTWDPRPLSIWAGIGLKEGDMVKIVGAWAEIDGKDLIMAIRSRRTEDVELKVRRTRDGFPYWGMTPEEIAKERSGN